jgi:hypothetical protein
MSKIAAAFLCLCALSAVSSTALAAQASNEPILVVDFKESCKSSYNWQSSSHVVYHLCTYWQGPMGGTPSDQLYKRRRSVKGLKPGEKLQFYCSISSGSASDSSGCTSEMVSIGDGRIRTTARNKTKTKTFEPRIDRALPPSAYPSAEIIRTNNGAVLHIMGIEGAGDGDLGYFQGVWSANAEMTKEQRANYLVFRLSEAELDKWENLNQSQSGGAPGSGKGESWEYSITVTAKVPDLGEAMAEVKDYEQWTPKGNLKDATKPGNTICITLHSHKAGNPKAASDQKFRFTAELVDVSSEPGTCMNWPKNASGGTDLRFLQESNSDWNVESETKASTRDLVDRADLIISCFDFGAWGRIKITAKDKEGKVVSVSFQGRSNPGPIRIPQDENDNHIADAWENENKFGGDASADEDNLPEGNGFAGDGLTAYEEYRGFAAKGVHVQGDPLHKDLFICDESRGIATKGLEMFKSLSGIHTHLLDREELGPDRVVNRNHGDEPHAVDQHGVLIQRGGNSSPMAIATTQGDGTDAPIGPPKCTDHVQLPGSAPGSSASAHEIAEYDADVAHEIFHSVGVQHHGAFIVPVFWGWLENANKPGTWTLWEYGVTGDPDAASNSLSGKGMPIKVIREADGTELKHGDPMPSGSEYRKSLGGYLLLIMGKGSEGSGDETCVMRYADRQAYFSEKDDLLRIIPDPSRWVARTTLCTGKTGKTTNSRKNKPEPRCGDATLGNCRKQIVVNDRATPK